LYQGTIFVSNTITIKIKLPDLFLLRHLLFEANKKFH
jgi:hypothetical protein